MDRGGAGSVAAVVAAKDEQRRIAATVAAAAAIPWVDLVVVVDDGSGDRTGALARSAGAVVVRHARNRGKGAAMESGAAAVAAIEDREGRDAPRLLLFLDADLEGSATAAEALVEPVRRGLADMSIAVLPPQQRPGGGHGFVVRLASAGVRRATGWTPTQPLSGQRCLTREAYEAARPLAAGFGVETALTIDLLRRGFRVREVEAELHHRVTGAGLADQVHRLRQYVDVARALAVRRLPERLWAGSGVPTG